MSLEMYADYEEEREYAGLVQNKCFIEPFLLEINQNVHEAFTFVKTHRPHTVFNKYAEFIDEKGIVFFSLNEKPERQFLFYHLFKDFEGFSLSEIRRYNKNGKTQYFSAQKWPNDLKRYPEIEKNVAMNGIVDSVLLGALLLDFDHSPEELYKESNIRFAKNDYYLFDFGKWMQVLPKIEKDIDKYDGVDGFINNFIARLNWLYIFKKIPGQYGNDFVSLLEVKAKDLEMYVCSDDFEAKWLSLGFVSPVSGFHQFRKYSSLGNSGLKSLLSFFRSYIPQMRPFLIEKCKVHLKLA